MTKAEFFRFGLCLIPISFVFGVMMASPFPPPAPGSLILSMILALIAEKLIEKKSVVIGVLLGILSIGFALSSLTRP